MTKVRQLNAEDTEEHQEESAYRIKLKSMTKQGPKTFTVQLNACSSKKDNSI